MRTVLDVRIDHCTEPYLQLLTVMDGGELGIVVVRVLTARVLACGRYLRKRAGGLLGDSSPKSKASSELRSLVWVDRLRTCESGFKSRLDPEP